MNRIIVSFFCVFSLTFLPDLVNAQRPGYESAPPIGEMQRIMEGVFPYNNTAYLEALYKPRDSSDNHLVIQDASGNCMSALIHPDLLERYRWPDTQ